MKSAYVRKSGRLALYAQDASSAFWDETWQQLKDKDLRHALRPTGRIIGLGGFFSHWLPQEGTILEAGCGTGLWLRRLLYRGYDCIGLDFAISTLMRSKRVCPELPFLGGDIVRLPFRDESLAAYLSFGVVEHFEEGPGFCFQEAARVLRSGGRLIVSVPYEGRLRRAVSAVSESEAIGYGLQFYQYYFSEADLNAELKEAGLRPTGVFHGQHVYKVLRGRIHLLAVLAGFLPGKPIWKLALDLVPGLPRLAAHMMFTVAFKP